MPHRRRDAGHMFKLSKTDEQRARTVPGRKTLSLVARFFLGFQRRDPLLDGMAERVRAVIARQPGHRVAVVAQTLGLSPQPLEQLMTNRDDAVDSTFLIDVISALVHESGMDPEWLLTGQYDPAMHRKALLLGEDRSTQGARAMRSFVEQQFQRVLDTALLFPER